MDIKLPTDVNYIISKLAEHGYRADVVGGPVRDYLLSREPDDFDITTNAKPEKIKEIFSDNRTVDTGIKHGTVSIIINGRQYEVTTYRRDGEYKDFRRPDSVSFTEELNEDLARRDFTMNAIAYSHKYGLTDAFGGIEDIKKGIIRAVGDPETRFSEDALRILRAVRFAATLGFEIEENTRSAMLKLAHLIGKVSRERVYAEWNKLLRGNFAYNVLREYSELFLVIMPELCSIRLPDKERFERSDYLTRMLSLFYLSENENSPEKYFSAMSRLKTDVNTRNIGRDILSSFENMNPNDETDIRITLSKLGEEVTEGALRLNVLLGRCTGAALEIYKELQESGKPYKLSHLNIRGNDLLSLGVQGAFVGKLLRELMYAVITEKAENERCALLEYAKLLVKNDLSQKINAKDFEIK